MRIIVRYIALGGFASAALVGLFLTACSSLETGRVISTPPEVPGATFVGNQVCADCHTNYSRTFPASAHGRFDKQGDAKFAGMTGCESCHGPGSLHVKAGGGRGKFIVNPGKDATACFSCHLDIHADFNLPQHHPVIEKRMNCVNCHDPHGLDILKPARGATLAMSRLNETCANCHREQTRPFVFEHEALREGCVVCHQPHGSINRGFLVERDNNLCLKCHAQIQAVAGDVEIGKDLAGHANLVGRGNCWSSGCHTAVHGSNVSPKLRF
jgi:predicted CXXCH cytochrome family protein